MAFADNVFVNCPYDQDFYPLLRPLLFTLIYAGFEPRLALESMDSGQPRISRIIEQIRDSKYAIHDLSRIQAERAGEYFRLNMPFELGLDVGCRMFGDGACSDKKCLVLERERYRYQAALSDISNSDISVHGNDPEEVTRVVRDWLNCEAGASLPGPSAVWDAFNMFMAENYDDLTTRGFSDKDVQRLPIVELLGNMRAWVSANT